MFKTIFLVRDGALDSVQSCEWPEHVTNEAVKILASLREKGATTTLEEIVGEEVMGLCRAFWGMQLRAQANSLRPYVLNSTEKPTEAQLLAYASEQERERK